jgi:hypothetical protein
MHRYPALGREEGVRCREVNEELRLPERVFHE